MDYFLLRDNYFCHQFKEDTSYVLILYTSNYGDYEGFNKCIVKSYDINPELTNE